MIDLPKDRDIETETDIETEPDRMKHLLSIDYKIIPNLTFWNFPQKIKNEWFFPVIIVLNQNFRLDNKYNKVNKHWLLQFSLALSI